MTTDRRRLIELAAAAPLALTLAPVQEARAQAAPPAPAEAPPPTAAAGSFLLTVFLRHDESKPLDEINRHLRDTGYYKRFPPPGIAVVSWYVMMGVGQVVTLRVPAERLREVNRALEETAWGGFRTEFYPTYDYRDLAVAERARNS